MKFHKNMNNIEVANLLRNIAASYEIKNIKNVRFRIIAYERAADSIEHLSSEIKDIWDEGKLEEVPGIGKSLAEHLNELFNTGNSKHFKQALSGIHPGIFELLKISGIGSRKATAIVNKLKVGKNDPLKDVLRLAKSGKIRELEGFGVDSEVDIATGIEEFLNKDTSRILLNRAEYIASNIIKWMNECRGVEKNETLGSLRRKTSTIGDIDIAVASRQPELVLKHFVNYPQKSRIIEKGKHSASILVPGNIRVDLIVQAPQSFGSLLQHFTGSKHHNIALREYALKKGMSLSEYGIKKTKTKQVKIKEFKDEKSFYKYLGLDFIPPELREDKGEIQAALMRNLPDLVELKDIKGDLQMHSDFDIETSHDIGESSMEQMVDKANELKYEYIAFTEHNPSQRGHNDKQTIDLLKRKKDKISKINDNMSKRGVKNSVKHVFNSLEVDILPNGNLPLSEKALDELDFALVSIHSSFNQSRKNMTDRVLRALNHPKVKIFAHPTGRILNKREAVELDWGQIFEFCIKYDKWIEINADPHRLDLPDFLVYEAVKKNIKLTIGTDAHHQDGLDNMRYGVYVARRGWAEKHNIINTYSLNKLQKMLK